MLAIKFCSTILITPVNIWLTFFKMALSSIMWVYTPIFYSFEKEKAAIFSECQFCRLQKPFFKIFMPNLCMDLRTVSPLYSQMGQRPALRPGHPIHFGFWKPT